MSLLHPNTNGIKGFKEKGLFLMAWRLTFLFSIIFSLLTVSFAFFSIEVSLTYLPLSLFSIIGFIYVSKTQNPTPIFWLIAISGAIIAHITLYLLPETLPYSNFLWLLTGTIFVYVAIGSKYGLIYGVLNGAGLMVYIAIGLENHLKNVGTLDSGTILIAILEILFAFGLVIYIMNQYQIYQTYARLQVTKLNLHLEQQNEAIIAQNKENITLVKEIHHRVKNNLQIIISLLRMQRSEIKSKQNKQYFDDMINRIMTMSMIHQRLYQEKEMTRIDLKEYLTELCNEVISLGSHNGNVKINVKTELKLIDLKTIVPLGLLVNELVSNSSKHAFESEDEHAIAIEITNTIDGFDLTYQDSGEWKENYEPIGFGIELIDVLTEQLNGTNTRIGTTYKFELHPFED